MSIIFTRSSSGNAPRSCPPCSRTRTDVLAGQGQDPRGGWCGHGGRHVQESEERTDERAEELKLLFYSDFVINVNSHSLRLIEHRLRRRLEVTENRRTPRFELRDEINRLRTENMHLKEEGLRQRIRAGESGARTSSSADILKARNSSLSNSNAGLVAGQDVVQLLMNPNVLAIGLVLFVIGIVLGKVVF